MKTLVFAAVATAAGPAAADGLLDVGRDAHLGGERGPRQGTELDLGGALRVRGERLRNLDLDRGLDPSGAPLYPIPPGGGQTLSGADTRLRTNLVARPAGTGVALKLRVDVLDNVAWGSSPIGRPPSPRAPTPAGSPGQDAPASRDVMRIKRAYGEVLTPLGMLAAGRMGNHWGLGILANGGDCYDCDFADAADRIAFATPLVGHIWAVAYDISATGPTLRSRDGGRPIDLEASDDVRTVTAVIARTHTPQALERRRKAGRVTFEYGAFVSRRAQENDVPADYLTPASPVAAGDAPLMVRDYSATAADLWWRLSAGPVVVEGELAYARARVGEPSVIPGLLVGREVTSRQLGGALESTVALPGVALGLDAGFASGDSAPGFGAFPDPGDTGVGAGDFDGPQANLRDDFTIDNFRFHPDYHVDQILFREILGTVTDAFYLRPATDLPVLDLGASRLLARLAVVGSWALQSQSTPGGARHLGFEVNPGLRYEGGRDFVASLDYGLLAPGAAFDNRPMDLDARAAQSLRAQLRFSF